MHFSLKPTLSLFDYDSPTNLNKDGLKRRASRPVAQYGKLIRVDFASRTNEWKVDLREEGDGRWDVWVRVGAVDFETVDAVLVYGL